MDKSKSDASTTSWGLIPLTPEYIEKEHGSYVKALTEAISDDKVTNIALSGNYGVGKSSILHRFANLEGNKNKVVEISLSTISPATTEEPSQGQASTLTNRIQKEIVKQLLYREQPHKTPGSRFRRIEQFRKRREAANSALVSVGVMLLFLLTGWTEKLSTALLPTTYLGAWEHLCVYIIAFALVLAVRIQSYGRFHIKQFAAGAATITLDDNSTSYFDQYLDEIVYFFQVSERTIVVFEDIDRFDDSHIFETLRSLNRLLNNAPQIGKKVHFIYAIKDSIFDYSAHQIKAEYKALENTPADDATNAKNKAAVNTPAEDSTKAKNKATEKTHAEDPAQVEIIRANRTKFFDLVIPVVPFISHRSARDLLKDTLDGIEHALTPELINIAGRYVPDMRLLKNVRNEFIVFRDRILSGDGAKLNLVENELLGMMLYKSTHLADFELIRLGKSNLDKLYEYSRTIVTDNVRSIESEISSLQQSSDHLKSIDARSKELGGKLLAYMERIARHAAYGWRQGAGLSFQGRNVSEQELLQSNFWKDFILSKDGASLDYTSPHNWQQKLSFTPKDVSSALNITLDRAYWEKLTLELQEEKIEKLKDDLKFLRSADMGCLIKRPKFKSQTDSLSLHDKAVSLLTDGLAYQLVRANAINRNFTLYTATFHGKFVTPAARSFIIHNVEQDKMDMHYQLNEADVKSLINECGVESLVDSAFYNIAILDYLLRTRPKDTYTMVAKLRSLGAEQRLFLQAYFNGGQYGYELATHLTSSPEVFKYLISASELDVDITTRRKLVSAALANTWRFKGTHTITAVEADFLRSNYASLDTLTASTLEDKHVQRVVQIFSAHDIKVADLAALSESFRQEFIKHSLYELTIDNLRAAVGGDYNLSLDALWNINDAVYYNAMAYLQTYLELTDGIAPTVADNSYFASTIEHVHQEFPNLLDTVISRAHESCVIVDLNEVHHDLWSCLARQKRFPTTFGNVLAYTTTFGGVDASLATMLLSTEQITETKEASEEDRQHVAICLISASQNIPSASHRVNLTLSLDLDTFIDVKSIRAEGGELFALMVDIKNQIVQDNEVTYEQIVDMDWLTKELFIDRSVKFANYMDLVLLEGELASVLRSQKIDIAKKLSIVARADDISDRLNRQDFALLTQFAVKTHCELSIELIKAAALAGAKPVDIITLLEPHLSNITDSLITEIMIELGDSYEALTYYGAEQPTVPNNQHHRALLERLKEIRIISKCIENDGYIRVYKKRG